MPQEGCYQCPGVRKELNITFRCQDEIKDDGTKAGKVIVHNQLGDGQTLKADCYVSGRKIVFLRARYSATDMYRAACKSEVANGALLAKLNALCKNKWKCDVKIGATQLGVKDPICTLCKPSYVQVYGRCAFSKAKMTIVDEVPNGLVKATIQCDSPLAVIETIQRAAWGRPVCQFNVGNDALGDPVSDPTVKQCNGSTLARCVRKAAGLCPGQPKMFISEYVCQDDIWNDGSIAGKAINHTVTLEGNPLEVDCMNGKKLQFVRAVYGATDRGFCPNEIVNGGLLTTLNNRCKNRSKCAMTVGNIELGLQDPCGGVVKALFADFM
ncbi:hypothetical protein COHA_005589 [Chlorella ohadii]|uniref:SUEL-type lectin domain-containing protein n=1 Tax=Chlorella ohadii TaxID=2649997 RepID=A0AAD5H621_9CHLO|nr:hypothetical protein COHA_005589 [Chlorella ohadii]